MGQLTLEAIIEALFFASRRSLSIKELRKILPEHEVYAIKEALKRLRARYALQQGGIEIVEVAGGYRVQTRSELAPFIKRLRKVTPVRLSKAALETLAIVAYKQPVTRAEIEALRGVDASSSLRMLLEHKLVRIAGKKDVPGRPLLYATTTHFLEFFQLKDLSSLPEPKDLPDEPEQQPLFTNNSNKS